MDQKRKNQSKIKQAQMAKFFLDANAEMDGMGLGQRFKDFFQSYHKSNILYKQHIAYKFLIENQDLDEIERCNFLCEIITDFQDYVDPTIRSTIIEITDNWEDTWLNMGAIAHMYYFGNNPVIKTALVLLV